MRILTLYAALLCGAAGLPASAGACDLTIGWESWPPYQMDVGGDPGGLDIDLVRHIGERAGCALTFREIPWARLLKSIEHGHVDAAMAAGITDDRAVYGQFTDSYRDETVGLLVRRGDDAMLALRDLPAMLAEGYGFGVWNDYYYGDEVAALMADPATAEAFHTVDQGATLQRMLAGNRVDGVLDDVVAGMYTARQLGLGGAIKVHGLIVHQSPVHLLLSRASVDGETVERLNTAIRDAKQDGSLAGIIAGYIGS